jgi:hypothetical protein
MENRDRDKMSRRDSSTEAGDVNRSTSERKGRVESDSNADFGQNIGRSENWDKEPSRRSGNDNSMGNESSRQNRSGSTSGSEH